MEVGNKVRCVDGYDSGNGDLLEEGEVYTVEKDENNCLSLKEIEDADRNSFLKERFKPVSDVITEGDTLRCIQSGSVFERGEECTVKDVDRDANCSYDVKLKSGSKLCWADSGNFEKIDSTESDYDDFIEIQVDLPEAVLDTIKVIANENNLSEGTIIRYMLVDSIIEGE